MTNATMAILLGLTATTAVSAMPAMPAMPATQARLVKSRMPVWVMPVSGMPATSVMRSMSWMPVTVTAGFARYLDDPPDAAEESADDLLYRAFYEEVARRDFAKAEALYTRAREALERAGRADAASAILKCYVGRARCLAGLGRVNEAEADLGRALALAPEDPDAKAELARLRSPDTIAPGLEEEIEDLIQELGVPNNDAARTNLVRMGSVIVPQLSRALRDVSIGRVDGAAKVLVDLQAPGAWRALAEALADSRLVYPKVILEALGPLGNRANFAIDEHSVDVFESALSRPEEELRVRAASVFVACLTRTHDPPAEVGALLTSVTRDASRRVRRKAFEQRLPSTLCQRQV